MIPQSETTTRPFPGMSLTGRTSMVPNRTDGNFEADLERLVQIPGGDQLFLTDSRPQ